MEDSGTGAVATQAGATAPTAWAVVRGFLFDLFIAVGAFGVVAVAGGMIAAVAEVIDTGMAGDAEALSSAMPSSVMLAIALAMMVAALVPYWWRRRATPAEIAAAHAALARASTWGWIVATLAVVLAMSSGLDWLDAHLDLGLQASNEQPIAEMMAGNPAVTALYVIVLAPVFEELLFRRVLFGRFLAADRPLLGYAVTGATFASFHEFFGLSQGSLLQTGLLWGFYFLMAVALAWVYRRTGSLWAPMLVHLGNNALALWVLSAA